MRKLYAPTVLGLIVLGGAAWAAARQPWLTTVIGAGRLPGSTIKTSGTDAFAPLAAFGLVTLAAGLGVLASSGSVRRIVGFLVVLVGAGGVAGSFADVHAAAAHKLAESPALATGATHESLAVWPFITPALFVVIAALGILVVVCARRWPAMSARYDAPTREVAGDEPADLWKALDDGRDPTQ